MDKTFVGFGFGAIQAGLFIREAYRSNNFGRLVVAEVVPETVAAIRDAHGSYKINVAVDTGIEAHEVNGLEVFNPTVPEEYNALVEAVCDADEIATALPGVKYYNTGEQSSSAAGIMAESYRRRCPRGTSKRSIIYAAENDNRAAEILESEVARQMGEFRAYAKEHVQYLNTVIGKMSGVVVDEAQIDEQNLVRMAENSGQCFLVEEFNNILISRVRLSGFQRGIIVFEEKDDLLPFEEAKLYGHNATHALIGYLAWKKGLSIIADASKDESILKLAREAFVKESGMALCRKHAGVDPLFTKTGYQAYADELLTRMMNPHLHDTVERVVRDPRRKLGWNDRLVGTMRVAIKQGIIPERYALGARAALDMLVEEEGVNADVVLDEIWSESGAGAHEKETVKKLIKTEAAK